MSTRVPRFKPGDRVHVRFAEPPGHIRTPHYIRGKTGTVERYYGDFPNPEELAYGKDGLPPRPLYLVGFSQRDVWQEYPVAGDKVYVDIYEHWLEPA
ncbi:MAG TPA: SH3-like domain-containing protein [Chloroflexota bacterium]|nr:SH3-like domain-containing protein [Chloroflexota bacterium]